LVLRLHEAGTALRRALGLGAAATDHDARAGGVDVDADAVTGALDLDAGGITTDHVSRWFSDSTKPGQRYADYVAEDVKIRKLLQTQLDLTFCPITCSPSS
jgi:hypothetical protein